MKYNKKMPKRLVVVYTAIKAIENHLSFINK